mmetsp:Transcript_37701/g.82068  ORF Transcript_37701/g.82068 Transcript_37701/m.82068 type:complete len:293 (+) Transcript_37701:122-1000(+)
MNDVVHQLRLAVVVHLGGLREAEAWPATRFVLGVLRRGLDYLLRRRCRRLHLDDGLCRFRRAHFQRGQGRHGRSGRHVLRRLLRLLGGLPELVLCVRHHDRRVRGCYRILRGMGTQPGRLRHEAGYLGLRGAPRQASRGGGAPRDAPLALGGFHRVQHRQGSSLTSQRRQGRLTSRHHGAQAVARPRERLVRQGHRDRLPRGRVPDRALQVEALQLLELRDEELVVRSHRVHYGVDVLFHDLRDDNPEDERVPSSRHVAHVRRQLGRRHRHGRGGVRRATSVTPGQGVCEAT